MRQPIGLMALFALTIATVAAPAAAMAETFQRPIPQQQTASAEMAYLVTSLLFLAALVAVQWLVNRR